MELLIHLMHFLKIICFKEVQLARIFFCFVSIHSKNQLIFQPTISIIIIHISLNLVTKPPKQNPYYQ